LLGAGFGDGLGDEATSAEDNRARAYGLLVYPGHLARSWRSGGDYGSHVRRRWDTG
jgi:hypothetical protein